MKKSKLTFPAGDTGAARRWRIYSALRRARHECLKCSGPLSRADRAAWHVICPECRRIMALKAKLTRDEKRRPVL